MSSESPAMQQPATWPFESSFRVSRSCLDVQDEKKTVEDESSHTESDNVFFVCVCASLVLLLEDIESFKTLRNSLSLVSPVLGGR